jgi:hypothetical protein
MSLQPQPVAKIPKKIDPYLTDFVTVNGEFIKGPTLEQAKEKVAIMLKKFKPEEWWAQKVCRFRQGKDDHLLAFIVKDYSKEHDRSDLATTQEDQMWFGREEYIMPKLITDIDNRSETFNQRIPHTLPYEGADGQMRMYPVMEKKTYYNYTRASPKIIELYKKMCGMTMEDHETEYIFVLAKGGRTVTADDPDDVFEISCEDAKLDDRLIQKSRRQKEKAEMKDQRSSAKLK